MGVSLPGLFCARLSVWFTIYGDWVVSPPSVSKLFIQRKKGQPIYDNSQEWFKMKESWPQPWNLKTRAKLFKEACQILFGHPQMDFRQKYLPIRGYPPVPPKKGIFCPKTRLSVFLVLFSAPFGPLLALCYTFLQGEHKATTGRLSAKERGGGVTARLFVDNSAQISR